MAKELKFIGNFEEVNASLQGVLLCGENGGPLILADIKLGQDAKDPTIPQYEFVFQVSSWKRPAEGDAAEPMETATRSAVWSLKGNNQEINIRTLNDGLGLTGTDKALIDDGEDHFRLVVKELPKSLVDLIGKPTHSMYLKPVVQRDVKDESAVKAIYYNFYSPPKRASAKSGISLADIRKMFKKDEPSF